MKPMLAYSKIPQPHELKFPLMCSYKLDGIRCYVENGKLFSRNSKPIPNRHINEQLEALNLPDFDGELMVHGAKDFNEVQSAVMSRDGRPDFYYNVFDLWSAGSCFDTRHKIYRALCHQIGSPLVNPVTQLRFSHYDEVMRYMKQALERDYEGLIMRSPKGAYKHGRSTLRQQGMLKLKYFKEDEGTIVDFVELMRNTDTSTKKKENMVPGNTLGAFVVSWNGKRFEVGTGVGMTAEFRRKVWQNRALFKGQKLTFKYQELSAAGIPRFPSYKVIRDARV